MNPNPPPSQRLDAVTNRLGMRLAGSLNALADPLPADLSERLRFARQSAVERAAAVRRASVHAGSASVQGNGTAVLGGPPSLWLRAASILPLIVLVAGLMLVDHRQYEDQIAAAAEVDAALLADDLPPAAYSDPGFNAFLKSNPTP